MDNPSQALTQSFQKFVLRVWGKEIPIPYRINIPPIEDKARRGKSSPGILLKQVKIDAREQGFNLKKASLVQIRQFMQKNKLGLDCSGFVYLLLNQLLKKLRKETLRQVGFPRVTRTNVEILTSDKFSDKVITASEIQPGDLIKINASAKIPHVVIVINKTGREIVYAHSSEGGKPNGVHQGIISIANPKKGLERQLWQEITKSGDNFGKLYQPEKGDKVVRLKILK